MSYRSIAEQRCGAVRLEDAWWQAYRHRFGGAFQFGNRMFLHCTNCFQAAPASQAGFASHNPLASAKGESYGGWRLLVTAKCRYP
jgi:hypothetical protein